MSFFSTIGEISKALSTVKDEKTKIEREIEKLLQRKEDAESLPLPREDFIDQQHEWIEQSGIFDRYSEQLKQKLQGRMLRPMKEKNMAAVNPVSTHRSDFVTPDNLAGLIGAQAIKDAYTRIISGWDWPETVGPPRHERATEMTKIDKRINELQAKLADLKKQAADAGVSIG